MSRTVLVGLVVLVVIGLERGFWWVTDSIWSSKGALDHRALAHEPGFVLATLLLCASVVVGLGTAAALLGFRWWPAAVGGVLAASPELIIGTLLTSGLATIDTNWFWFQVGRLETLCHYPGWVIYGIARDQWPLRAAPHWLFETGPVAQGTGVVEPLYWVTLLSGLTWAWLGVTAVTLFVHWRDAP